MPNIKEVADQFKNIKKRVVEDTLKIEDRTFQISKFDPLLGNYIVAQLLMYILPFGMGDTISQHVPGFADIANSVGTGKMLGKAEFLELQRDILKHAVEILPGDKAPVVRPDGTYGIMNFTQKICIELLIAILAFNFSDFFVGKESTSGVDSVQDSNSANTKTSAPGFTYL